MGLTLTYLSLALILAVQQPDSRLVRQSKQQADHYIANVHSQTQVEANLWALNAVTHGHPELLQYVQARISTMESPGPLLSLFEKHTGSELDLLRNLAFTSGSKRLFIALLLQSGETGRKGLLREFTAKHNLAAEGGIQFREIADTIIRQDSLDQEALPVERFDLLHFFLFKMGGFSPYLAESYVEAAINRWDARYAGSGRDDLLFALYRASHFHGYYHLDRYSQTEPFYAFFFEDTLIPNSKTRLDYYRYLDFTMYQQGYYDRSLDIVRNYTIPLAKYIQNIPLFLSTRITQAVNLQELGKIQEAKKINLEVLERVEELGFSVYKPTLYYNLATTYYHSGNYDKFLEYGLQGLEISREQENYTVQLNILENLYHHYRKNNDVETALSYLEQAAQLAQKHGNSGELGSINTSTGVFYRDFENNPDKAWEYFTYAEDHLGAENNYSNYITLQFEKAKLLGQQERYSEALRLYDRVITIAGEKEDVRNVTEATINSIDIHLARGNLELAREKLAGLEQAELETLNFEDIIKARTIEARFLSQAGNPGQAHTLMRPVIEQIIHRAQYSTEIQSGFWTIEPEYINAFEFTANLLIREGRTGEAVLILDELKTINDARLYQNPLVKSSLLNETELNQYQQLTKQLDNLRKQLLAADSGDRLQLQQRIQQLNSQKQRLDRKISTIAPRSDYSIREIQSKLSAYEQILHITELNDRYYIATVTRTGVSFDIIELTPEIRALFHSATEAMAQQETDLSKLRQIARILNLNRYSGEVEKITVIPDSYLYQLPLGIMPLTDPSNPYSYGESTYLIEKTHIHYLSSMDDFLSPPSTNDRFALSFSGYGISDFSAYEQKRLVSLPFASREVTGIASELTNFSTPGTYLNEASTEHNFKQTAPRSRIVHLATHSEVSQRDPLFSTIYMTRNQNQDGQEQEFPGQVFAYELFELNLNNELIMLNSCESGTGNYLQGSGIMGISRALRYAGAKSLVLNLWSVQDMMASDFAIQFYRALNKGLSKSEALRNAQLYFLTNKNAEPHYWGPYMLIGNDSPVVHPNRSENILVAASFMAYLLLLAMVSLGREYLFPPKGND